MADSRTITINLKAVSDFNDVVNNAKQIQTILSKLKLPEGLRASFDKVFSDMEKNGEKAANAVTKGFKTKGDVTSFERAVNSINGSLVQLQKNLGRITPDILENSFKANPAEVKAFTDQIIKLKQELSGQVNTDILTSLTAKIAELKGKYTSVTGSIDKFYAAFKSGDIVEAKTQLDAFEKSMNNLKEDSKRSGDYLDLFKKMSEAFESMDTPKARELREQIKGIEEELSNINVTGIENLAKELDTAINSMSQLTKQYDSFAQQQLKAAEASQQMNSSLDQFKHRIGYFFGAINAINLFKRALRSAFETVKDLDKVMTETAVVTKFDVSDMWKQLPEYTKRANELGVTIHSAYEAATLYYQQGLATNEVMEVSNQTLKMARIAGLDAAEATDRMTNALRGFNMEINEVSAEKVADVYSKLAAMSASNVDEISTAMTKVASLASNANMEFETTAAFLAQIIETTRESAETAGTALKTVIARFSEVKKLYSEGELLGTDEEGEAIDVNKVSKALRTAGVDLNEYLTGAKGLDDIFVELASKWDNLDQVQQRYIATMAAGSRQQSRFIALMQDYGRTQELVSAAQTANGASQEQYEKTLESMETKLNRLKNAWNEFIMDIANNKFLKGVVDALTNIIQAINKLTNTLPGALSGISKLGLAFAAFKVGKNVFNRGLAQAGQIFRTGSTKIGENGAAGLVNGFTTGIKGRFENFNLYKALGNSLNRKDVYGAFYKQLAAQNPNADANSIANAAKAGATAWENEANSANKLSSGYNAMAQSASSAGLSIQQFDEKALKTAVDQENLANRLNTTQTALMAVGSAAMIAGALIRQNGGDEDLAKGFTTFGMVLTGLGAFLPILGTIVMGFGKTVASAGAVAQAGWGWIGLILAAIAALITIAISSANKGQKELDKLKDRTEAAENATKKLQDEYDNLRDSIESVFNKKTEIDHMITGTNSWKQAVQELNMQILDLLDKFPELINYLSNENGVLTLDTEGIDKVYEEYADKIARQQVVKSYLETETRAKELDNTVNSTINKINSRAEATQGRNPFLAAGWGGEVNESTIMLEMANAINGNTQALEKFGKGGIYESPDDLYEFLKNPALFNNTDNEGNPIFNKQSLNDLIQLAEEVRTADIANNADYEGMIALSLDNLISTYGEDTVNTIKGFLDSGSIEAAILQGSEKTFEELSSEERQQYETYFKEKYGDDFKEVKANGGVDLKQGKDLTAQEAMGEFQAYMLPELVGAASEGMTKAFLTNPDLRSLLGDYGANKQGSFTKEQLSEIEKAKYTDEDNITYKGIDAIIQHILANSGLEKGSESYQVLASMLESGLKVEVINSQEIFDNPNNAVYTDTGFSAGGITKLGDLQSVIGSILGEEVTYEDLKKVLGLDALKEAMGEDFPKLGNALEKITDFSDKGQLEEISNYLQEVAGDNFPQFEDALKIFIDNLIEETNAIKKVDVKTALSTLQDANSVINKIRSGEQGRAFSKEDFNAIENLLTKEERQNFMQDAEGNWVYLGDSMNGLELALHQNTEALLADTKAYYEGQIAAANQGEKSLNVYGFKPEEANLLPEEDYAKFLNNFLRNMDGQAIENLGIEGLSKDTDAYALAETNPELLNEFVTALLQIIQNKQANQAELDNLNNSMGTTPVSADWAANHGGTDNAVRMATRTEAAGYGLDPDEIIATSEELQKAYNLEQQIADRIALDNARINAGVKELTDNYADWAKEIDAGIGNPKYASSLNGLKKAINNIIGVSEDLDDQFYTNAKNMKLMADAANGDMRAIAQLQKEAAKGVILGFNYEERDLTEAEQEIASLIDNFNPDDIIIGASLDDSGLTDAFNTLIANGVTTADAVSKALEAIGWEPQIEYEEVKVDGDSKQRIISEGGYYLPDGEFVPVSTEQEVDSMMGNTVLLPRINGKGTSFKGSPSTTVSPSSRGGSGGGGGGGGGGKSEKPTYWKNPYDELYNLTEKINEALRTREALERRYQKIAKLGVTTAGEMRKAFTEQIDQLKREIELQKQLQAGRLKQLKNVGNEIYTDKEGNRSTFSQLGVTRYAKYDEKTGLIQIDWDAIEAVSRDPNRSEEGEAIEAYISKLEELVEGYEEIRDTIWDMEDEIEELVQQSIDDYLDFESRVYDAMVAAREKEIEAYGALSDAIQDSTSRVLNKMQEQIESERQARENDKTEEEIADREARLAYLSRDTSGANQLEIMKLQQEIDDARQSYTDSLIDQAIQEMQKDADKAAEQREQQQALLEAQLKFDEEQGIIMAQVEEILRNSFSDDQAIAMNDEELKKLLQDNEAFKNMSSIGKEEWLRGFIESWNKAQSGYKADEEKKKAEAAAAAAQSTTSSTPTTTTPKQPAASTPKYPLPLSDDTAKGIATSICFVSGGGGWGNWPDRENRLVAKFGSGAYWKVQQYVEQIVAAGWSNLWGKDGRKYTYASFKTGGLADFTGPAWLDGSRSHPEMVLNAADTENLIMLKDILNSILKRTSNAFGTAASELNFDIDINADLSNDYDVEQLADKVKGIIYDEAMYKNVNTVNRLR